MTMKELRRMRRGQLLQLLIDQMEENQRLRSQLADQNLILETSGTMAEAALRLSGIFEAADRAAQLYLQSVERKAKP